MATDTDPLRPTIEEVAALLHSRTSVMGNEIGTFNDSTRPTGDQVDLLIDIAVTDVRQRVGSPITDDFAADARHLAALQSAALVEASFFPDSLDSDRSAYRQYTAMYLSGLDALSVSVSRGTASGSVPVVSLVDVMWEPYPIAGESDEIV